MKLKGYLVVNKDNNPLYQNTGRLSLFLRLKDAKNYIDKNKNIVKARGQKRRIVLISFFYD